MQNNIDSLITTGTEIIDLFTSNPKLATNKFLEWNNQVKFFLFIQGFVLH